MQERVTTNITRKIEDYLEIDYSKSLGEGAYGKVFKAVNKSSKEVVAVKFIPLSGPQLMAQKYLFREASGWQFLNHQNVSKLKQIHYYEQTEIEPATKFMILESEFSGINLNQFVKTNGPVSQELIRSIAFQTLHGLSYMHGNQFFHRDIKESNILINENKRIALCDFGFIRKIDLAVSEYTNAVGTTSYRSPEQAFLRKEYSCQIDIWALGVVLVNLILQTQIFANNNDFELVSKLVDFFGREKLEELNLTESEKKMIPMSSVRKYNLEEILQGKISLAGIDLILKLLEVSPLKRIEAKKAIEQAWFTEKPESEGLV